MTTNTTGRYSIGEEIYCITFKYSDTINVSTSMIAVVMDGNPDIVVFNKLTVKEHHKVPNRYDLTDTCNDGYVLEDENGIVFHNQYPYADYGQVSDAGDRYFVIDFSNKSEEIIKTIIDNKYNQPYEFVAISELVANIYKAIANTNTRHHKSGISERYKKLYELITTEFTKKYPDKKIAMLSHKFISANGAFEWYPEIYYAAAVNLDHIGDKED